PSGISVESGRTARRTPSLSPRARHAQRIHNKEDENSVHALSPTPPLTQLIRERKRMLHPVADRGSAVAPKALQLSGRGPGDNGIGLLCLTVLEYSGALQHEAPLLPADSSDDPLEANERRRAVAPVHHQVLDLPFALDIGGQCLRDGRPGKLWQVGTLAVGLLVPGLDGESSIRVLLHWLCPGSCRTHTTDVQEVPEPHACQGPGPLG